VSGWDAAGIAISKRNPRRADPNSVPEFLASLMQNRIENASGAGASRTMPMPSGWRRQLGLLALGLALLASPSIGGEPAKPTPGLLATQLTISFRRPGVRPQRRQFQATVVRKSDDRITVITAAHCLATSDEGLAATLKVGEEVLDAKIVAVVRNPSYQGEEDERELPGPDNAVARFQVVRPTNRAAEAAFRSIRPASGLAANDVPKPVGQTLSVRMIDGHGVEHAVRAGNYANPRWLEWGPGYRPIPGDSGAGVFTLVRTQDQTVQPVLIGVIVGQSGPGGGASLVSLRQEWLAKALPVE
jgi:hypothetical protein